MGKRRRPIPKAVREQGMVSEKETEPDPKSYEYFHDEIDTLHDRREKILLEKGPLDVQPADSSSEDEVLGLDLADSDDSDDDEDKIAGYKRSIRQIQQTARKFKTRDDIIEKEAEIEEGWGDRKSHYYGADIDDGDELEVGEGEGEEEGGGAMEEEREALALQRKMAEQMEDADFGLDSIVVPQTTPEEAPEQKIQKDLTKLSRREKLELLKKESPEFLQLRDDFIDKMTVVNDILKPVQRLVKDGELPNGRAAQYVNTRIQLYMNYCLNINFYMLLKSKQISVQSHPVIKRILQFRNIIKQLETVDKTMQKELEVILKKKAEGKDLSYMSRKPQPTEIGPKLKATNQKTSSKLKDKSSKRKKPSLVTEDKDTKQSKVQHIETSGEREASLYYRMAHGLASDSEADEPEENATSRIEPIQEAGEEFDGKRGITYQMAKNKGLTSKKKKLQRNPRVKHRMKYKKALVKRRSAVREARLPLQPYGGELSGIRAGIKRGVKLQ